MGDSAICGTSLFNCFNTLEAMGEPFRRSYFERVGGDPVVDYGGIVDRHVETVGILCGLYGEYLKLELSVAGAITMAKLMGYALGPIIEKDLVKYVNGKPFPPWAPV